MFKYAFIMNSSGLTPETYSVTYKNNEFYCFVTAVSGMEMSSDLAKKLAEEEFQLIDLCGDYDASKTEMIKNATNNKLDVCYAKYTEEELEKLNSLDSLNEYGIIIMADGIEDKPEKLELKSDEFNTYITIVGSDEMAIKAAKEMVGNGIAFIELCSYFDLKKAGEIAEAIERKVPIGYCG